MNEWNNEWMKEVKLGLDASMNYWIKSVSNSQRICQRMNEHLMKHIFLSWLHTFIRSFLVALATKPHKSPDSDALILDLMNQRMKWLWKATTATGLDSSNDQLMHTSIQ